MCMSNAFFFIAKRVYYRRKEVEACCVDPFFFLAFSFLICKVEGQTR
uniref:Alternative protein ANKS6 n=1 Tax=Homo sapiens TaxID=9606 RepID=L8E994_HUMAN|nr:alternative protein ANKS6 [Homo sapiens]